MGPTFSQNCAGWIIFQERVFTTLEFLIQDVTYFCFRWIVQFYFYFLAPNFTTNCTRIIQLKEKLFIQLAINLLGHWLLHVYSLTWHMCYNVWRFPSPGGTQHVKLRWDWDHWIGFPPGLRYDFLPPPAIVFCWPNFFVKQGDISLHAHKRHTSIPCRKQGLDLFLMCSKHPRRRTNHFTKDHDCLRKLNSRCCLFFQVWLEADGSGPSSGLKLYSIALPPPSFWVTFLYLSLFRLGTHFVLCYCNARTDTTQPFPDEGICTDGK